MNSSFEKLQDKTLPITVKLLALCPTKDLLAIVLSDSEIAVYRVLWQKLSSFVIPSDPSTISVTTLEWSPDGNFIAVGRSDGVLDVFQLESDDDCQWEQTVFSNDSIASLYWADLERDMGCIDRCYQDLIQREEKKEYISKQVLDKIPSKPSVLWLSSCNGFIRALMHGRVPLWSVFVGESVPVSHLYFSKQGYLFYARHTRCVTLHALSFQSLQHLWGPFSWFAENVLQLDASMRQYQTTYQKLLSTLKEIGQVVKEKWNILNDMLKDYDEEVSDVRAAFLSLINGGQVLSVFTPYFVNNITLMGAERWKKQIQEKIAEYLMPFMKEVFGQVFQMENDSWIGSDIQLSILIREMLMRWSRLQSFLHHQHDQQPDIFTSMMYHQTMEWKQRLVGLLHHWNDWKQRICLYVERLSSFLDWFCYHTSRCSQENGCVDRETPALPTKSLLKVILFLDINDTPEEWFSPTKEWLSFNIDEWKEAFDNYYRELENRKCVSLSHLVWSFPLVESPSSWFLNSSETIVYQDRNEEEEGIMIAYILPETQQLDCLWLKHNEKKELTLSTSLSFTMPMNACFLHRVVWYRPQYLLWFAIQNETETNAVVGISKISSPMTLSSSSSSSSSSHTLASMHSIPLTSNNGVVLHQLQVSSSPSRNLIGIQMDNKRIILFDTTSL